MHDSTSEHLHLQGESRTSKSLFPESAPNVTEKQKLN